MSKATSHIKIEPFTPERTNEVADLFQQAVHRIDPLLYTLEQQEAWAPTPPDYTQWRERLAIKQPWLAMVNHRVAGFIESGADGYIDCLYTHPDFQQQGVASALYEHLLRVAESRGLDRLYVEASVAARAFFEHRGFLQTAENKVHRNSITLINFTMEKRLTFH